MATNKEVLYKGMKFLLFALPLIFIGPSVVFSAFKNEGHPFYIPILGLGAIVCLVSMYLMFKGFITITKSIFDGNK